MTKIGAINSQRLSVSEYERVLDTIAVGCVDVAILYKSKILLVRRAFDPIKGEWWIFGGRIFKGEALTRTAYRGIKRELGLDIQDESRFKEIGTFSLVWPTRSEPHHGNGCHHILIAHSIEITPEEFESVEAFVKDSPSYQWFDIQKNATLFTPELNDVLSKIA